MSDVTVDIKALLEAGAHFGHKTSRWHPKMAPYIHSKRGDIHIIDLTKTVEMLETAITEAAKVVARGGKILFVGTKNQVKDKVKRLAEATNQFYVNERWVGGTLTNAKTISLQIRKLHRLEKQIASGELEKRYNKLEVQRIQEEIDALNTRYGGIKSMMNKPAMVIVTDAIVERNAINEAKKTKTPVVAFCDTNADPTDIDFVVPTNDDAIKALTLILGYFETALIEANKQAKKEQPIEKKEAK